MSRSRIRILLPLWLVPLNLLISWLWFSLLQGRLEPGIFLGLPFLYAQALSWTGYPRFFFWSTLLMALLSWRDYAGHGGWASFWGALLTGGLLLGAPGVTYMFLAIPAR